MTSRQAKVGLVGAAVALAVGCGTTSQGALSGSVSELFSLATSSSEVLRNDEAIQISFLNTRGSDLDVVVRVAVSLKDITVTPGEKIPLAGEYAPGHQRTSVAHAPGGEPARLFPPLEKGDLVITSGGQVGQVTSGNFSMLFQPSGGDIGAGRTLVGNFSAMAQDAGFGPEPDAGP